MRDPYQGLEKPEPLKFLVNVFMIDGGVLWANNEGLNQDVQNQLNKR